METESSFGAWIRRRRNALGLLQKELALQVGCSVPALQKIERDERRPSRSMAERLAEALDVPADERAMFVQAARGERLVERLSAGPQPIAPTPEWRSTRARPALPVPATTLFGRDQELTQISQLLHDPHCRLLTLTGPGGIGKTHLAIEAATQQQAGFADGAAFVPLAPLVGREQTITTIADSLGLVLYTASDRAEQLIAALHAKQLLLLLDNFEHLLAEPACVALVGDLVRGAPALKLLVTSREPLRLQAEWVFEVQGLPVPESAAPEALEASSAARLFLQRARRARVGFTVTADDRQAVYEICQLVAGLPLGIELAAAWVATLSCREIAREIGRNLDFLAATARDVEERHRSIRAAFDHSWKLLSAEEQRVLRQLAIFRGSFSREAAEHVASASLASLSSLVSKSLLRHTQDGRYELHDLVRQYGLAHLQEDQQGYVETANRHAHYYAGLLERRGTVFRGPDQPAAIADLIAELPNVRQSWSWAASNQYAEDLSRGADTLFWLYEARSNCREGVPLFGQAVHSLEGAAEIMVGSASSIAYQQQLALGQVLSYQGFFCLRQGQHRQARTLLQRSHGLLGRLAEEGARPAQAALATATAFLGTASYIMGEYGAGQQLLQDSLAMKRALDDRWGTAFCLRHLGLVAYYQGDYDEAYRLLSESLALSRAMGNTWAIASSLNILSMAVYARGAYVEAQQLLQEGLQLSQVLEDRFNIASALTGLGQVSQALGHTLDAQRFFEDSTRIWREIGDEGSLTQTLNQLGQTLLVREEREGAQRCFLDALAVAKEAQIAPVMLEALLGIAALRAAEGDSQSALELVLQVLENPACTRDTRDRAEQLRAELVAQLPAEHTAAIQARSQGKTLETLAQNLLAVP
jgi:predicted ATPase/transcriptional regulator with XRE-family HTH domain